MPDLSLGGTVRGVIAFFLVAAVTLAAVLAGRAESVPSLGGRHTLGRPEWVIPLVLLDLLFALFVLVQLPVLFYPGVLDVRRDGVPVAPAHVEGLVAVEVPLMV